VVDTIVPYVWMGLLIAAVKWQPAFDRWNNSDRSVLDELKTRAAGVKMALVKMTPAGIAFLLFCALTAGFTAQRAAQLMPQVKDILSPYAWTIIIVSFIVSVPPSHLAQILN